MSCLCWASLQNVQGHRLSTTSAAVPLCSQLPNLGQILSSAPQGAAEHMIKSQTLESATHVLAVWLAPPGALSFLIYKIGIITVPTSLH